MTKEYALALCREKINVYYNGEDWASTIEFPSDQVLNPDKLNFYFIDKELAQAIKLLLDK